MNIGIRPVDRPQSTGSTDGVNRREDGSGSSSAFSPKTNVSIKNAVDDMAGILAKISSNQAEAVDKMPEDLQKVIQNVLKQAFALNESLGQGLGSTLESQRFSMDQLGTLSRMLLQLGNMAEKGMTADVSDTMQALLTNLKTLVSADTGAALEPVLLSKTSFALLDDKSISELPEQLQQLLAALQPQGQTTAINTGEGSPMAFLKQLVQYFMPRPDGEASEMMTGQNPGGTAAQGESNSSQPQAAAQGTAQGAPAGSGQPSTTGTPASAGQSGQPAGSQGNGSGQQPVAQTGQQAAQQSGQPESNTVPSQNRQTSQSGRPGVTGEANSSTPPGTAQGQSTGQPASANQTMPENSPTANQSAGQPASQLQSEQSGPQAQQTAQPQQTAQESTQPGQNQSAPTTDSQTTQRGQSTQPNTQTNAQSQVQENNPLLRQQQPQSPLQSQPEQQAQARSTPQQNAINQAKTQLMMQTMENTPQAMDTMKSLAQLLLREADLTPKDAALLQNFVNGQSTQLTEKDARQLQQMIRLCQVNVPATVQQAALQQEIPDLPRLWAFMQLCDMTAAKRMNAHQLKRAGKDVAAFAASMRSAMGGDNSSVQGQRSLNFMLPMYMGEESTYPAYIHVFDEKQPDPATGEIKKETWLRLCVLTDNIGAVELTCRVYNETQLDMRLFFSDTDTANEFRQQADALKESLKDSSLKLNELKIGAAGERRFL